MAWAQSTRSSALLALSVSVGIAVIAELYPSIRAMRLLALDAIRNE